MIKEISVKSYILKFKKPFQIAYEEVSSTQTVVIKISDEKSNYGLGSAAPDPEVTGETIPRVLKILRKYLKQDFFNLPINQWYYYHEKIQKVFKDFPSAQSAVEEAVLNLFCQQKKIPLSTLFGGYRTKTEIMVTISILDLKETLKEVKSRLKEEFSIIKLKCGINLKDDIKRIKAVIKILPSKIKLTLDANQGYSFNEAKKLLNYFTKSPPEAPARRTAKAGGDAPLAQKISLIEQPINSKNIIGLKKLTALKSIPVVADESVVTIKDAFKLLVGKYVDGVNIKLMKCGGPINFLKIFHLAKSLNKIIMLGCMYESNISITTGAHLALALPIDFVDLDSGHLDFPDDPAVGGAKVVNGKIQLGEKLLLK